MKHRHPALALASPSDCGLAIAIPLSKEQFLSDLLRPQEKDFIRHFIVGRGLQRATPNFCWQVYLDEEASFTEAVCSEVVRHGVTVRHEAKLADLTDLLIQCTVVTLVAHWRFVPIKSEDIRSVQGLLENLRAPQTKVQTRIRQAFEALDSLLLEPDSYDELSEQDLRQRTAAVMNRVVANAERRYWDETASEFSGNQGLLDHFCDLRRMEFEQAFPDDIVSAGVIEFCDGIHTLPELIDAVPNDFAGLLDLTVCNSVIPASFIRSKRPGCLVAANRRPAELRSRMYLYGLEISLLAKQPRPFSDVIKQVHTEQSIYNAHGGRLCNLFARFFKAIRTHR